MDKLIERLRKAREEKKSAQEAKVAMIATVTNSSEYIELEEVSSLKSIEIEDITEQMLEEAKRLYELNGRKNKTVHSKVSVAIRTKFSVTNMVKLRKWVIENLPIAMVVEESLVKDYALKHEGVEGVTITKEETIRIASDLS